MKRLIPFLTAVILTVCLFSAPAFAAPADWPKKLVFGIIPTDSTANITERFDSLVKHLERKLGLPIEVKVATDYAGVITGMQFKHVDFAYFGPKSYVEASRRAGAEAFVIEVSKDGAKGYHGLIITKKGSGLKTMADLKGKVWAFVDPNSTSGTLVPMVHFVNDLKIDPAAYFSKVIYSGSHEASMISVKAGKIDAASTNDLDMARGNGKQWNAEKDFEIIWKSPLIPGSPMAYRKDLPESLKKALAKAFLGYSDKAGLEMLKVKGYAPVTDRTYDPIRALMDVQKRMKK
ncbi:MAG TPA: phosphonate ABC transporter substrate-binding protein [Syntrophales bacterium]|mgnify:CR=1 FL=1|nr:phosphonate ABC transporter substrate-binding protein [Syntrophales bacterium]